VTYTESQRIQIRRCLLYFTLYFSTPVLFQDHASGDVETDIKPNLTICKDGNNVSHEMEECNTRVKM